jgi:multiple sugar transport system permease protein
VSPKAFARLLVAPAVLLLLAAGVVPLLYALWTAVHSSSADPSEPSRFVGLANFSALLADGRFGRSLAVTAALMAGAVLLELSLGLLLALALAKVERRRGLLVSLLLVPSALAPLVAGIAWWMLFNTNYGAVNALLGKLGLGPVEWTRSMPWAFLSILAAVVWQGTPFVAVVLLGGLTTVPASLLEAARLDGAGRWAALRHVVLPHLRPFFLVAGLLVILDVARVYEIPMMVTEGGPGDETWVAGIYLFKLAFHFSNFGGASAMALLLVAALTAVSTLTVRLVSRRNA